jgi:hypothetical protein
LAHHPTAQQMPVSDLCHPFGACQVSLERTPRAIRLPLGLDVQDNPRDLTPVGPFGVGIEHDRRPAGRGAGPAGAPHVSASKRAEEAVTAEPNKSDGRIAEEIGVGKDTVRRACKSTGASARVEKLVGMDVRSGPGGRVD